MSRNVTVSESLFVAASPEAVWDFTQDYTRRMEWDGSILEADILQELPELTVRIRGKGGLRFVNRYTLYRRPERTTVSMEEVRPSWISGGGGSWSYEASEGGTLWSQTNTLSFSGLLPYRLLGAIMKRQLLNNTRRSMRKAKELIEA